MRLEPATSEVAAPVPALLSHVDASSFPLFSLAKSMMRLCGTELVQGYQEKDFCIYAYTGYMLLPKPKFHVPGLVDGATKIEDV